MRHKLHGNLQRVLNLLFPKLMTRNFFLSNVNPKDTLIWYIPIEKNVLKKEEDESGAIVEFDSFHYALKHFEGSADECSLNSSAQAIIDDPPLFGVCKTRQRDNMNVLWKVFLKSS